MADRSLPAPQLFCPRPAQSVMLENTALLIPIIKLQYSFLPGDILLF